MRRDPLAGVRYEREQAAFREKAKEILDVDRIDMLDFTDIYGEAVVANDMRVVAELKKKFISENTQEQKRISEFATVFEALLLDQIDQSMWFGEQVTTVAASEYDDYINGVDVIANVDVAGMARANTGLAIDVTFSSYSGNKVDRILNSIRSGEVTSVKYFENGDVKGQLKQIPRVVLATEGRNVEQLARTWLNQKNGLVDHPIKLQLADQIHKQLGAYFGYATRVRGIEDPITDMYRRQYELWGTVFEDLDLENLRHSKDAQHFFDNDTAHEQLMKQVNSLSRKR